MTDSLGHGTGGSVKRTTKVNMGGVGVDCQVTAQECGGGYYCSEVEARVWDGYQRWDYDISEFQKMHQQLEGLNAAESSSVLGNAAA